MVFCGKGQRIRGSVENFKFFKNTNISEVLNKNIEFRIHKIFNQRKSINKNFSAKKYDTGYGFFG